MIVPISSLDDPRLAAYRNLKDRDVAREHGLFIAEGEHLVRRLLASDFQTHSVLVMERRAERIAQQASPEAPVYVVPDGAMKAIVGFKFHQGVLACGVRRPCPSLESVAGRPGRLTLVICPNVNNTENLGAVLRVCAGFGADGVVLGESSCDPFARQAVRVSMGAVFTLPIARSENLLRDLARLRNEWGVELAAAVLHGPAEPLESARRSERFGLLFGGEAQGLPPEAVAACARRITLPMRLGTDSFNVAVAAGIFLYHFTRLG
jgi:tRNA G18 (ribose-2'-O)-methylase SpoU